MRPVARLLLIVLLAPVLAGRAGPVAARPGESHPPISEAPDGTRDAFGALLPAGPRPERIVSLSPNLTEILFAIGVKRERIVGVTRFCDYPPETRGIARIGGIVDPSIEAILSLRPDLVLATRGNPTAILDRLRAAGVRTYAIESQGGIGEIYEAMRVLVRITAPDDSMRAGLAIRSFSSGLACLRSASERFAGHARPRVYYYDPASPDWTAGPGTHVSEAINLAGGENIGDAAPIAWPRLSTEVLIIRGPQVIAVAAPNADTSESAREKILARMRELPGWSGIPAVRDGRLCLVPADWLLRPGPRVLDAIRMLGRCLHPDGNWGCGR